MGGGGGPVGRAARAERGTGVFPPQADKSRRRRRGARRAARRHQGLDARDAAQTRRGEGLAGETGRAPGRGGSVLISGS